MISVNAINYRATQLIDRALSGRDPDHYRIVLLEWATALEMLLASEGGKKVKLPRCACKSASNLHGLQSLRRSWPFPASGFTWGAVRSVAAL